MKSKESSVSFAFGIFYVMSTIIHSYAQTVFDNCDHVYQVNPGYSYLESPYYPNYYPANTACRYKFSAPVDYTIEVACTIEFPSSGGSCTTDFFYLSNDGDLLLRGSEQFCGSGSFTRKALFRDLTMAYISYGGTGRFRCQLYVKAQPCDCGWSANTRIVNGQQANANEFPHMAVLKDLTSGAQFYCGASIISTSFLLTAAHCADIQLNPNNILALVGYNDVTNPNESQYSAQYRIAQIIKHPNYVTNPIQNDIALMRTTIPINFSRGVGPICLPTANSQYGNFDYANVDVIGYGTTSFAGPLSNALMKVSLLVTTNSICQQVMNETTIYASEMCTYDSSGNGRDSCQYDSGGPVIFRSSNRMFLLGCISYGGICGQEMGINTRITSFLPWIYQMTDYSTCPKNL